MCGARVIRDRWLVDVRCRNAAAGCVTYWPRADIVWYRATALSSPAAAAAECRAGGRGVVAHRAGRVARGGTRQRGVRGEVRRWPPRDGVLGENAELDWWSSSVRPADRPTHLHNWSGFLRAHRSTYRSNLRSNYMYMRIKTETST